MLDPWYATDSVSTALAMTVRDTTARFTNYLGQAASLLHTQSFATHDSTQIGLLWYAEFAGDTSAAGTAQVTVRFELVDSATGTVMKVLDSAVVDKSMSDAFGGQIASVYDLLSGTYYLRMRIDTVNMHQPDTLINGSRYAVAEMTADVSGLASKLARLGGAGGSQVRVMAQPNPFTDRAQVLFSIPRRDYVSVRLVTSMGVEVRTLLDRQIMDGGRYAIELDGDVLTPGAYLIEVRTSTARTMEKVIVNR